MQLLSKAAACKFEYARYRLLTDREVLTSMPCSMGAVGTIASRNLCSCATCRCPWLPSSNTDSCSRCASRHTAQASMMCLSVRSSYLNTELRLLLLMVLMLSAQRIYSAPVA